MRSFVFASAILCLAATTFAAPQPAAKPAAKEKEDAATGMTFTFEAPEKQSPSAFSSVTLRTAGQATYLGLQFGTGKTDVAYVCFDREEVQSIPDRCYFFIAGTNNHPVLIRGRAAPEKAQKNAKVKTPKAERFELPPLRSRIGGAEVLFTVELTCGHGNQAGVHLAAEGSMKDEKVVTFKLLANLSKICFPAPNEIKVLQLIGPVSLHVFQQDKVHPPWVRPYLTLGENFIFEPIHGTDADFSVEVKNSESEKIIDKGRVKPKVPDYSGVTPDGAGEFLEIKSAKAGGKYEATASIDLGPFGHPSMSVPVGGGTAAEKKKK